VGSVEEAPPEAFPSAEAVKVALEEALLKLSAEGTQIDSVTIAGNGEPTLHPELAELVEAAVVLRDGLMPGARLSVLTNGSTLHLSGVVEALNRLDERVVKLDAGDWASLRAVNLPHRSFDLDRMISSLPNLVDCVIQSMFVRGRVDNTTDEAVAAWIARVAQIAPLAVQIYSLDRVPADRSLEVVPEAHLRIIARKCEAAVGVPCEVY
jgi:wyosine [tRNA(Phe)-imidazoG37] synthetase (radical SAM superfamily)